MAVFKKIEAKPAPLIKKSFISLIKENLFSSVISSILTILSFYLVYIFIPPLLDWLIFDATWTGIKEEITKDGARWIFIKEKFNLFMYGFYPSELYWRPNMVLGIFIIYIILFKKIKNINIRTFVIVSFPIIAFILISGGLFLRLN